MSNRQLSPVSYRRFQAQPLLSEGLLAVERQGGDLERKVAMGLARMADEFGARADKEAERAGRLAGARDALAGAPTGAKVTGGAQTVRSDGKGGYRVYTGSAIDQAKALLRDEEGFRETPYWDVNASRVGYGSDTVTLANGKTVRVTKDMRITKDDAERDLDYRLSAREGAQVRRQLGDALERLPANAQAALYSVAYNYGSLPSSVVAAGRTGDIEAIAAAVEGLSSNPERRRREAAIIRGGGAAPYVDPMVSAPNSAAPSTGFAEASVAPISVTPGQAGSWRPSGRNTIRGRAYDVAGTRTYLEMADMAMVENQQAIFEQYRDDPVMLEKALGEGLEAELRDNVLDEIAPEFTVAYKKRASTILSKARAEQQEKQLQQNRVEFLGRVEQLENRKSQQLAGLDPSDEAAAGDLADLQASIDAHWDSAVARGVVDLDDAEKFKRSSRSDTTVGFYVRQASKMGADDILTMRTDMTKDYAEGKLEGVSADDWTKIEQGLAAAESARRTQDVKADADLTKRGEDLAKRVARGLPVTPEEVARFQLDAGTAPKGKEIVGSALSRMRVSEAIRTVPIGQVEKNIAKLLGEGATTEDIDFARKTIAEHRKDLETDPLGVAERFGVLPVSEGLPLDGEIDPSSVSAAFSERINAAKAAADHFGTSPKFFRPGEAAQIEATVKADPQRGLDIAAGLVDAAGPDADRVLRELGDVAPAVSLSGSLIAAGGNRQAAMDLIAGFGKTPDGKEYGDMPNTKRLPAARELSGEALAYTPSEVNRLDQAAAAIARKRLFDAGIDPKKDEAKEIYERAYQEAAGASFSGGAQFGGFADYDRGWSYSPKKVLLPPSVRADKFEDLMEALADTDLGGVMAKNGKAWTARDFQRAMPVAVKGGFVFAMGDISGSSPMFIADEKGDPIVLDLDTLRPALEPRVPGAYR